MYESWDCPKVEVISSHEPSEDDAIAICQAWQACKGKQQIQQICSRKPVRLKHINTYFIYNLEQTGLF